jgi:phage-related minor tail protein
MAVAFVVAGVALEWRSVALADYGYSSQGQVSVEAIIQQLTWVIAPILITVGLGTIVALLFWQAIHWTSPRPGSDWSRRAGRRRAGDKAASWRLGRWS